MSVGNAMRRLVPPGSLVLFLSFLTGIWLTMSPFAMTTQPSGQPWIASTITTVTIGVVLLRDLLRETQAEQEADQETVSS